MTGYSYNFVLADGGMLKKRPGIVHFPALDAARPYEGNGVYIWDGEVKLSGFEVVNLSKGSLKTAIVDSAELGRTESFRSIRYGEHDVWISTEADTSADPTVYNVWYRDMRLQTWARIKGWRPLSWGRYVDSSTGETHLYYIDADTDSAFVVSDTAGTDRGQPIEARAYTATVTFSGQATVKELYFLSDHSDSIVVWMISTYLAGTGLPSSDEEKIATYSPVAGDTTAAGFPVERRINLRGRTAHTVRFHFWVYGTRCELGPLTLIYEGRIL